MTEILIEARNKLSELNRVCTPKWGQPKFPRLQYSPSGEYEITPTNAHAICRVADALLSLGEEAWVTNPDFFETSPHEVILGTVDRYGLPLRTVFSLKTGLMRSDPYYSGSFLKDFYDQHYRGVYDGPDIPNSAFTRTKFLSNQVSKGVSYYDRLRREGIEFESVLDFGCGMGGALIPFEQSGKRCVGCDWSENYLNDGRRLGLNLIEGGLEEVRGEGPFDLVIVCHALEHVTNVREFLSAIFSLLTDQGSILVEVPGIFGIPRDYQGNLLRFLQNAHVWHFTQFTLERLLRETGFWPVYSQSTSFELCIASKSRRHCGQLINSNGEDGLIFLERLERDFCSPLKVIKESLQGRLGYLKKGIMPPRRWLPF